MLLLVVVIALLHVIALLQHVIQVEGGRGNKEIATCIYDWILQLPSMVFEMSSFSDTCGNRNCNQNVAAMFLDAVQRKPLQEIMHNFLECGHWSLSHGMRFRTFSDLA